MFERASKKLGLDQAIFLGGAFQNQDDDKNKKLSKNIIFPEFYTICFK